jgi:prephenate dehydrogenase
MTRATRPTVAIAGLGLIGGSLAKALTEAGYRVIGVDTPARSRAARSAGALAGTAPSIAAAACAADVLVLAAPPAANLRLLRQAARVAPAGLVITDVSSVKRPIGALARRLRLVRFVGGHPMAGRERSGFAASSADLFRGCPWILAPSAAGPRRVVARLARAVGARPVVVAEDAHDRAMAYLSHLPQVVAWALSSAARRDPVASRLLRLAGPGFRDMTRLAASPRALWREVLAQNAAEVARARKDLLRALRPGSRR